MKTALCALVATSLLALAGGAAAAPEALATTYGVPLGTPGDAAYVRALGARDGVLGLLVAAFLASGERRALRVTIGLCGLAGAGDFAIVFAARGLAARSSLAIHGAGTLGLAALWALLGA
jgi:hypothetical protein